MTIRVYRVALLLIAVATTFACSKYTLQEWVKSAPSGFVPLDHDRVPLAGLLVVDPEKIDLAITRLGKKSVVEIAEEELSIFTTSNRQPTSDNNHYLVRAVNDGRNGEYSAFIQEDFVVVLWGAFGDCGNLRGEVILISTEKKIEKSYANCFGID
jgi:hypothetical protein